MRGGKEAGKLTAKTLTVELEVHERLGMKLATPEIVWHSKEPLLSADFHRAGPSWRLATGGADNDVKIWKLSEDEGSEKMRVVFMASLSRHTKAVNVVRFSPNGDFLASAGDDSVIHIWKMSDSTVSTEGNLLGGSSESSPSKNKENWSLVKLLRGHLEDVYDLCWSPDSSYLISGSVDNSAIVWDVQKGQQVSILKESKQYIQGVAWDPLGEYVTTLSTDRNLRVYSIEHKFKCIHTVNKLSLSDSKQFRLWMDEGSNLFFRRLSFSPDGSFLIVPAGRFEAGDKVTNATYVFARNSLSKPVLQLPGPDKATVVVKCCPVLFELLDKPENSAPLTTLPYRMVYAVASLDSVLLYDTQHTAPFAYISKIHYSGITDMAWSDNGLTLVITSSDCYCTIVSFDPNELGTPLLEDKLPAAMLSSKHPNQQHTSPSRNCSTSPLRDEVTPDPDRVHESSKQTVLADSLSPVSKSPSPPPLNGSQSNSNSATGMEGPETKPRRIRPTMISSFTSPNGKISNDDISNQDQATHSPQPVTVSDYPSPSTPSLHTQSPPSQTTPSVTESNKDPSTASNSVSGGSTAFNGVRTDSPMGTNTISGTEDGKTIKTETNVPRARRVNFTTLDTFTSPSSKTQTKTGDKTASSRENGGDDGKETSVEDDCIIIE